MCLKVTEKFTLNLAEMKLEALESRHYRISTSNKHNGNRLKFYSTHNLLIQKCKPYKTNKICAQKKLKFTT